MEFFKLGKIIFSCFENVLNKQRIRSTIFDGDVYKHNRDYNWIMKETTLILLIIYDSNEFSHKIILGVILLNTRHMYYFVKHNV